MGYNFVNGSPQDFAAFAEREKKRIIAECDLIVTEVVQDAVAEQKHILDTATTSWGDFRKGQGRPSAGRREDNVMYDAITSDVTTSRTEVVGEWGWLNKFLEYFKYHDAGTARIGAANSMADSFIKAEQDLKAKVKARLT